MSSSVASPEAVGMSPDRLARISPVMQSFVDQGGFSGISVVIARRGQTVFAEQFGFRDKEAAQPMTADTIFRIYSMTKPIVSTALMMLYEEGSFQLLDPVAKFIPAFATVKVLNETGGMDDPIRPIQIRDLLSHTAGLTYDFLTDSLVGEMYRDHRLMHDASRSLERMIGELARLPLAFQPGTRWNYSLGIDVAAHLVEVISGKPLGDFLQERIFGPLGMVDTGFGVPESQVGRLSAMYGHPDLCAVGMTFMKEFEAWMSGDNARRDVSDSYPTNTPNVFQRGGHGLYSTAGDYLRFAQMLLNNGSLDSTRLIGRKTLELMHSNHLPPDLLPYELGGLPNPGMGFGLGSRVMMEVAPTGGPGSVGEYGWAGAAKTYYWVDPREELVGVFMSQYMVCFDLPEMALRTLTYQAIVD